MNAALFDLAGHDYRWAVEQLAAGRRVRRKCWPMEWVTKGTRYRHSDGDYVVPSTHLTRIHRFPNITRWDGKDYMNCFFGWGGVIGADGDETIAGHYVSGAFRPSGDDALALDWELSHPKEDGGK